VGPVRVVAPSPLFDVELRVAEGEKPVLIQALVAQVRISAMPITQFGRWRSSSSVDGDHRFRMMSIMTRVWHDGIS